MLEREPTVARQSAFFFSGITGASPNRSRFLVMGTSGSAGNAHWWCTPPRVTFSPVAGRDYDAFLEMKGRQCWISVRLIDGHDMDEPVAVTRAAKCADARVDTDSNSTSQ